MRAVLSAAALACFVLGFAAVSGDEPRKLFRNLPDGVRPAAEQLGRSGNSPLPTQVWWTERPGDFIVYESGFGRLTEFDSWTRRIEQTISGAVQAGERWVAVPAPNGKWSAMLDPRVPAVWFTDGDIRQIGDRQPRPANIPDHVLIDPNPQALAVTFDSKKVLVACDTTGPADRRVCIYDVETGKLTRRAIKGSSNLRGIAVDPRAKFALAVHLVHKSGLPSTQIEQGWVFTNALTYLSLEGPEITVTLPLDLRTQGFANPEGVAITPDGSKAYVAHAGADLVSVIDLPALLKVVSEESTRRANRRESGNPDLSAAAAGRDDRSGALPPAPSYLADDLRLTRRYVKSRIPVGANPRAVAVAPDGKKVAVANRLDDSISIIDAVTDSVTDTISLFRDGERIKQGEDENIREGEKLFHSGRLSFSGQFSCASCHPDGHADGLNWDLPADGFNNFFNTKSLLGNAFTVPYGWLGQSPTLRDRFTGTLRHLFQHEPTEAEAAALENYLVLLRFPKPAASLSPVDDLAVLRGQSLFEGKAACMTCHSGSKFTDRKLHDVGTGADGQTAFDTPALLHVSTTPPYLHDGRAATLDEIFARHNPSGRHGRAASLSPAELADLVEYLKSL